MRAKVSLLYHADIFAFHIDLLYDIPKYLKHVFILNALKTVYDQDFGRKLFFILNLCRYNAP